VVSRTIGAVDSLAVGSLEAELANSVFLRTPRLEEEGEAASPRLKKLSESTANGQPCCLPSCVAVHGPTSRSVERRHLCNCEPPWKLQSTVDSCLKQSRRRRCKASDGQLGAGVWRMRFRSVCSHGGSSRKFLGKRSLWRAGKRNERDRYLEDVDVVQRVWVCGSCQGDGRVQLRGRVWREVEGVTTLAQKNRRFSGLRWIRCDAVEQMTRCTPTTAAPGGSESLNFTSGPWKLCNHTHSIKTRAAG
jgi:hypothetical protein